MIYRLVKDIEDIERFAQAVEAEEVEGEKPRSYSYQRVFTVSREWWPADVALELYHSDNSGTEITPIQLGVSVCGGLSVSADAPLTEWKLHQGVDDGNLLTELVLPVESEVVRERNSAFRFDVYGPPGRESSGMIELTDADEDTYLLSD